MKLFLNQPSIKLTIVLKYFLLATPYSLHGLRYIWSAAVELKDQNIDFRLVGGNQKVAKRIKQAQVRGAKIEYQAWLQPLEVAKAIARADLCLGGPFGNTIQSHLVITGKTFQSLACASPTLVGQSPATEQAGFKDKTNCLVVSQATAPGDFQGNLMG